MEETLSLILHGCKLARVLESRLSHLSNQPMVLYDSCDELVKVYKSAMDRISSLGLSSSFPHQVNLLESSDQLPQTSELDVAVQEWLRASSQHTQTMDLLQAPFSVDKDIVEHKSAGTEYEGDVEGSSRSMSGVEFSLLEDPRLGKSPVVHRSRKRKDGADKRTVMVAAPTVGNTESPPEDGYTWRKYGQKEILGSAYPRGYFRCTHKSFYGCEAKKQVQRLDNDPSTFEVTYYGHHTCHISPTAPSGIPSTEHIVQEAPPNDPSIQISTSTWLSMNRTRDAGGPSNASREAEFGALDLADAMFNNSGSSNNSMESIFHSSMQDK